MRTIQVPDGTQIIVDGVVIGAGPGPTPPAPPNPPPAPPQPPAPPAPGPVPANVQVVGIAWPKNGESQTLPRPELTGFGAQIMALKITCPADIGTGSKRGTITIYEKPGSQGNFREITISDNPGDFTTGPFIYNGIGSPDLQPAGQYMINDPQWRSHDGLFGFVPGQTVYVNVRNYNYQPGQGNFDVLVDFLTPTSS
jgi:hypothetical protein